MSKHFIINENKAPLSKDAIKAIATDKEQILKDAYDKNRILTTQRMRLWMANLKHTENRIIILIDLNYKDSHTFESGQKIYVGRRFNNLNVRETNPVNAIVISGEDIPKGAEILIHPHGICDTNKINGYESISAEQGNSVRYYSIEVTSAFLWRIGDEDWEPLKGFATALRVFKPYTGIIENILPTKMKDILYITSGYLKGKVCNTLKAADYEIVFMDKNGQENRIIRLRNFEGEHPNDREEVTVIRHDLTEQLKEDKLLIGLSEIDCKKLNKQ